MSDTVNHQGEPGGVTWDITIDGQRFIVIEEPELTDCGWAGSREAHYVTGGCHCDVCRAAHAAAERRSRLTRLPHEEAR